MDLFVIHAIVEELRKEIAGAFISKVYQMNRTDLLFRLRRGGEFLPREAEPVTGGGWSPGRDL